jgi:hypothetical protein
MLGFGLMRHVVNADLRHRHPERYGAFDVPGATARTWPVGKIRLKTCHIDKNLCRQSRSSSHRLGL